MHSHEPRPGDRAKRMPEKPSCDGMSGGQVGKGVCKLQLCNTYMYVCTVADLAGPGREQVLGIFTRRACPRLEQVLLPEDVEA